MWASSVVNYQWTGAHRALRARTQTSISARSSVSLTMRRSKHCAALATNSGWAMLSQLPCLGV